MSESSHRSAAPTRTTEHRPGERIEPHWHDEHQLMYVSAGVVEVTTDRGSWVAPPQRATWVPAGARHEHLFHGPSRSHTVGFARNEPPLEATQPTVLVVDPLLRELLIACADADAVGHELVRLRTVTADRLRRAPQGAVHVPRPRDPLLARACRLVEADLTRPWTAARLAAEVGVSTRTLSRLFRTDLTMSYPQWRTQARLAQAVRHLAEGRSVTEVAGLCGWATPSAFVDVYRRSMGHTPGRAT